MIRRNFGSINFDHSPVSGYRMTPRYQSEPSGYERNRDEQQRNYLRLFNDIVASEEPLETEVNEPPLGNQELPTYAYKSEIVQMVRDNPISIFIADTGSGKSTQIPQFLYEAGFRLFQTQPRRAAAQGVSERIGDEVVEVRPETPREISAYQTAEINTITDLTQIANYTDGLYLAKYGASNHEASEMIAILFDEVHESSMNIEMLLALAPTFAKSNPNLRIVIVSATVDGPKMQTYFMQEHDIKAPILEIPGRTFGVERQEFPNETAVERTVMRATEMYELNKKQREAVAAGYTGELAPVDILVACPGKGEIKDWMDEVQHLLPDEVVASLGFLSLHSKTPTRAKEAALAKDYPVPRIIFSTNFSKTSITFPKLAGVVDCGYSRHEEVDENGISCLTLVLNSRADCLQWSGRAGRVAPGWYDLAGYSKDIPFVGLYSEERLKYEIPESQRTNLDRYVLRAAADGIDFAELKLLHRVKPAAITRAKDNLRTLGALDANDEITTIGMRMNEFPLSVHLARMMIEADQYSPRVRAYMAAIVASQEVGGLQLFTHEVGRRWKELTEEQDSDLLAQLDIFIAIQDMLTYQQQRNDLDTKNVQRARETYWKVVRKSHADTAPLITPSREEYEQIIECICAGMVDQVYTYNGIQERSHTYIGVSKDNFTPRLLSNRSVVTGKHQFVVGTPIRTEKYDKGVRSEKSILETVTVIDDISILGKAALTHCVWKEGEETQWRNGRPTVIARQFFYNIDLGRTEERPAEPSEETRQAVIAYTLEHPGPAQQHLRDIKKQLEKLDHLTNVAVRQITQSELIERVTSAAPADVLDPYVIDYNLGQMNLTLDDFISPEECRRIIENAPETVVAEGCEFPVIYRSGQPLVRKYKQSDVRALRDNVYLPDGREVKFLYQYDGHSKAYSVREFPEALL